MPNITFIKNVNTFTFSKGRSFPLEDPAAVNVPVDYSDGGQLYAYDKGIKEKFFNLVLKGLPRADFDNFENWLTNIAVGPKNTFTFIDELGSNYTVRLLDSKNPLKEVSSGRYSGQIRLRKEVF